LLLVADPPVLWVGELCLDSRQEQLFNERMNMLQELRKRLDAALSDLVPAEERPALLDMVRRSQDLKFGDYQANCAMPLGKKLGRPPRDVAATLVERLDVADFCEPLQIAGPGFINFRLKDDWLLRELQRAVGDPRLGVRPAAKSRTYVIDYSAPNVAKPMHVGHIRSTVIGDALCRTLRFLGHKVTSDNHLGDWGTQFGMIIFGYKTMPELRERIQQSASITEKIGELGTLYQTYSRLSGENAEIREKVLEETKKLHSGDPENLEIWKEILPACLEAIDSIYRRLGVSFDETLGESFYHDRLEHVVKDLLARGIAQHSEGAVCVFTEGQPAPMLIQKQDGAYLYATTDLATIQFRIERWSPDAILYVVDHRQSLHFEQLFAAARLWGFDRVELAHISFGTVLGEDGRPYKTRSGDTVGLAGLLDEAEARAHEIVSRNDDAKPAGAELSEETRREVARVVGIAALKYADLSQNRTSDYVFSYDKMLAMNGNTATYMQYAYARVRSIFAKGDVDVAALRRGQHTIAFASAIERGLGMKLLQFEEALEQAIADYRPNQLTTYLFELAEQFSTFFQECPVLKAESNELRASRLLLCDLTARTIAKGLELLGIQVVEKM
jgi:arginyl-tRNA synthetase